MTRGILSTLLSLLITVAMGQITLQYDTIGTSGNPFSVINNLTNQVQYDTATGAMIFIHRTDQAIYTGDDDNHGNYRFDVSYDYGATWQIDRGLLNPGASNDSALAGRFPQAAIYNPPGNTDADSSYMIYMGTYHDAGANCASGLFEGWNGSWIGRARLDDDTAVKDYTNDTIVWSNGDINVLTGLSQSQPGVFWAASVRYNCNTTDDGIILYKGVWNDTIKEVEWGIDTIFTPAIEDIVTGQSSNHRFVESLYTCWDPTGGIGYIVGITDLVFDDSAVFDPVFYYTEDSGNSWNGPVTFDMNNVEGILVSDQNQGEDITAALGGSYVVDNEGRLNFLMAAYPNTFPSYPNITSSGWSDETYVYHVRLDSARNNCADWVATPLDRINTESGIIRGAGTDVVTQGLHSTCARSLDGNKLFFFWTDSDDDVISINENVAPDLKGVGFDVTANTYTEKKDFTKFDPKFAQRAYWPSLSNRAYNPSSDTVWNIPGVIGDMDDNASSTDRISYFFVQNLDFSESEFTVGGDPAKPEITLVGNDIVTISACNSETFNDPGYTVFDCSDDSVDLNIQVINNVNNNVGGCYDVIYIATDSAGNSDTATRTVIVIDVPVSNFSFNVGINGLVSFTNNSTPVCDNFLGDVTWQFGDGIIDAFSNNPNHQYTTSGTYTVTLTVTNACGQNSSSQDVTVGVINSIDNVDDAFSSQLSIFPNPAESLLNVEGLLKSDTYTLELHDMNGRKVLSKNVKGLAETAQLDVSQLASGVYNLSVIGNEKSAVRSITVK